MLQATAIPFFTLWPVRAEATKERVQKRTQPETIEVRAARGDRSALEALLREHAPAIIRLCHHLAGPVDGRDAAQEALTRIATNIHTFDPASPFKPWAYAIARNACRDRLRRRGLERAAFAADPTTHVDGAQAGQPDPERLAIARADTGRLAGALETLPEDMRTALVLFHVQEESYESIAAALDVPIGTVMTWLHRGRKKLRAALEDA